MPSLRIEDRLPPDLPLRTCARCGWPCVTRHAAAAHLGGLGEVVRWRLKLFGGLVRGRPVCGACLPPGSASEGVA